MYAAAQRISIVALLLCMPLAHATSTQLDAPKERSNTQNRVFEDPLRGIVINRSITVLGNDFYQYFATAWRQKDGSQRYSITVYERPSARWGSEVWVQFRQTRVFHTFLSPARQAARKVSEQAVEIVYKNIVDNEIQRALSQSDDLGKEEL